MAGSKNALYNLGTAPLRFKMKFKPARGLLLETPQNIVYFF
jgi:hypothetical protein